MYDEDTKASTHEWVYKFIEEVIRLIKCDDLALAEQELAEGIKNRNWVNKSLSYFEIAFEAVFGYRDGYCLNRCMYYKWYIRDRDIFEKKMFEGPERLKCYQCTQLQFVNMLADIAEGKGLRDITRRTGLLFFLELAYKELRLNVEIAPAAEGSPFTETLIQTRILSPDEFGFAGLKMKNAFNRALLRPVIGYSLGEFLLHDDWRRLKRCEECKRFYISKTIRPSKFCSDKCRLAWHNRKRIESGEAREYKRRKREEGAKESYYDHI